MLLRLEVVEGRVIGRIESLVVGLRLVKWLLQHLVVVRLSVVERRLHSSEGLLRRQSRNRLFLLLLLLLGESKSGD